VGFGAGAFFKVRMTVDMVKGSFNQKPFRKAIIEMFGAKVIASLSAIFPAFGMMRRDLCATDRIL
jgi:predicted alternative tryptophan synthase beta-subunit